MQGETFASARPIPTGRDEARDLRRLSRLARLLDSRFGIPGTRWRFGLDSLIGLIPGVGDATTAGISGYIILEGHRLGVSKLTLARMGWNVAIDLAIGAIPVIGDVFDVYWKANSKNIDLIERDMNRRRLNRSR